jgi:hypothetical protein
MSVRMLTGPIENNTGSSFTWAVNVNNSDSTSPYYYLYFENEDDNTENYYSALFRVDAAVDAASTLAATTTVTPTPSLQASQTTLAGGSTVFLTHVITQSATVASSRTAAATSSSATSTATDTAVGLSTGAKVGLGVGIPLGIIALIAAACIIIWAAKRSSRAGRMTQNGPGVYTGMNNSGSHVYVNNTIPMAGPAPYAQDSPYGQQGVEMDHFAPGAKPYGYAPVQQQPINQGVGMHELADTAPRAQAQELDTNNEGHDGLRKYR